MWPEISKAKSENRRELVLKGESTAKRIAENGLDDEIFNLLEINFLQISESPLDILDGRISQLQNLSNLVLRSNKLTCLPSSLTTLTQLKVLDVSENALSSVPDELSTMSSLLTLDLRQNSIESLPSVSNMTNLHELLLTNNKLTILPDGLASLIHLQIIQAGSNLLQQLPDNLQEIPQLKELNVPNNMLTDLPLGLSQCGKLRVLDIRGNKFKEKRLVRLSNSDNQQAKPIFNYLKPLYEQTVAKSSRGSKGKSKKKAAKVDETDSEEETSPTIKVLHHAGKDSHGVVVKITPTVSEVRPFIVCCILRNIDFNGSPGLFKKFISLQTELHDTVCEKRLSATIATHDLKAIRPPLFFDACNPTTTKLVPLGFQKETSAADFMVRLQKEADEQRKQKKRNTVSGIHKYLTLMKDHTTYPFLLDHFDQVISFPPITNCAATKINEDSTDILVEVTSSKSLPICKSVMEALIEKSALLGIGADDKFCLVLEQVKITDLEDNLRTVYPSKADLVSSNYEVDRD